MYIGIMCPLCNKAEETQQHIFNCPIVLDGNNRTINLNELFITGEVISDISTLQECLRRHNLFFELSGTNK